MLQIRSFFPLLLALFLGAPLALPHGGTYTGPGDTVPPGGGGGGGGGAPPTPGPGGGGPPTGGGTPGPGRPTGGPSPGNPTGSPGGAPETGGGTTNDWTDWQYWWAFNRAPYLDLKARIHGGAMTGDGGFYIGHGQERRRGMTYAPSRATLEEKVLPVLLRAIREETNNDVVTAAMVAAAKIGDTVGEDGSSPVRDAIRTRFTDSVQEIRETAVLSLGILASPASLDELIEIANDSAEGRRLSGKPESPVNQRTRSFAVYGMGLIAYANSDVELRRTVFRELHGLLSGPREATRDVKVAAAISAGLVPVEPLVSPEGLEQELPWSSREAQVRALREMHDDRRTDVLRDAERAHLSRAMVLLCDGVGNALKDEVAASLVDAVGHRTRAESSVMRQSAVLAIGGLGDCDGQDADVAMRAALLRGLSDPDPQVQFFSLIAMGQVGGRCGDVPADEEAGRDALRKTLTRQLAGGKRRRAWAALAIGIMERELSEAGRPVAQKQLEALDKSLRAARSGNDVGAYAVGLGIARARGSADGLLAQLDRQSEDAVRGHLSVGLGLMDANVAIEPIQEIVSKSKYRAALLEQAAIALGLLGDRGVASELERMLRQEAQSLASQAAIASALGFIGDARSVDPLLELSQDESLTDLARAFAIAALGIVGDKEPLPWNAKLSVDLNYRANASTLVEGGKGVIEIL